MTGLGILLRTFLRRDWLMILCWVAGGTILYWSQGISVKGLYATQAEFDRAAASMENNAALIAMVGPARALNTVGGQVMWQSAALGAIVAGLMSMFLIGRHTRVEEETGRDELLRAAPIGRLAPMTAALGVAVIANLAMGLAITASLVTLPLEGADSLATGLGLTGVGWVFSGVALVAAQLTQSPRAMYGVVGVAMGAAYVLRAVGDIGNGLFSWLSPIGWYQAMHPFSGLRWWPMLLLVAASVVGVVAAYQLFARRDIGSGMLAARPGPGRAGEGLVAGERLGLGLAWRLQRGTAFGWAAGLFLGGLSYGSIGNDIGDMVGDGEAARDMFVQAGDLVNGFYATAILMLAMIATGFAVSSAIRPRGEEDANHAEVLLATATPRSGWLGGHVLVTVVGTLLVLVCAGLGLGLGNAMVTGDAGAVTRLGVPVLAMTAPVLVVSGVARLLYGVAPRLVHLAWLVVALAVVVMMFGELLRIPQWIQDLSPFEHLALVPAEDFRWTPFLAVLALAAALSVAGQLAFRRRDVH